MSKSWKGGKYLSESLFERQVREAESQPLMGEGKLESHNSLDSSIYRAIIGGAFLLVLAVISINTFNNSSTASNLLVLTKTSSTTTTKKPNFVFLLIDDMGYGTVGYDDSDISFASPFLSSLAKEGVMLTKYYSQEICSPARASLLTGRYPSTIGFQYDELAPDVEWGLNSTEILFPEVLADNGYTNYMVGKWNLGHYRPELLPTARGFNQFVGFMSGQIYHWSKIQPQLSITYDFMKANESCYDAYTESDKDLYSTFFYRDRALDVIERHDFTDPMFLYLAVQAVHDPFDDNTTYSDGLPSSYFDDGVYDEFAAAITGQNRLQYALSLKLLDTAMSDIVKSLEEKGQWENTYLIVASDNGGCYQAGGRNGDLRGCKGSLFEGGVKVDGFMFSPSMSESVCGTQYDIMMHVSDWFPTMLDIAGISYTPTEGHEFDGVSHRDAIFGLAPAPREYLLYNIYYNVAKESFNLNRNAPVAIRNSVYKLVHGYPDTDQGYYYNFSTPLDDDTDMSSGSCPQKLAMRGTYTKMLFNLEEDPNETTNLYSDNTYSLIKKELYDQIAVYAAKAATDVAPVDSVDEAEEYFAANGDYVLPWLGPSTTTSASGKSYPKNCKPADFFSVSDISR